jgi:hypothetical protein
LRVSERWGLHNLVIMSKQVAPEYDIARTILDEMCLEEKVDCKGGAYYSSYGGASKNYYACTLGNGQPTARLLGVVVTARRNPDLSYHVARHSITLPK